MGKNAVFVFSGTGNSLWLAMEIARLLPDCELVPIGDNANYTAFDTKDSIGFVYPTYFRGLPIAVEKFAASLTLQNSKESYIYAVATCGSIERSGNSISQLSRILKRRGVHLDYTNKLAMFPNYLLAYDMREDVEGITEKSQYEVIPILEDIKQKTSNDNFLQINFLQLVANKVWARQAPHVDKHYSVSDICIHCSICQKVCPVNNISMQQEELPQFHHHCEQCLACIHSCPTKAINYKDQTQARRRYIHPAISWKNLAELKTTSKGA